MKYISKASPPAELQRWFDQQPVEEGRRINCGYKQMPSEVKAIVKQRLLDEQGRLCCYTGRRIDEQSSHIEHFKPQSRCANHEDVDYNNLLAAFPGDNEKRKCPYGAHARDNCDESLLVSPLHPSCENSFRFSEYGIIQAVDNSNQRAQETINRLRLHDQSLTELRRQAIESALYRKKQPISPAQLKSIAEQYCLRDKSGNFFPFCYVIVHAAQELIRKAERARKRKQAIRSQDSKK
ncbi:MAG TPA: TIGR02646 family protein [Caldilineaceae bacterium]|nr:TIGR02646 family protein [Caldilineaceae bacterium]